MFSLEKRKLRGDIAVYNSLMRESGVADTTLFSVVTSDRTQRNCMKPSQGRFHSDIRKEFFNQRLVGPWNRLPRDLVTASRLTEFKKNLENALRHMTRHLFVTLPKLKIRYSHHIIVNKPVSIPLVFLIFFQSSVAVIIPAENLNVFDNRHSGLTTQLRDTSRAISLGYFGIIFRCECGSSYVVEAKKEHSSQVSHAR
ncbi:hypothetical protein WISP_68259 [Willisornis vidua]|uniref:Uncharacterized protein n=1 Tax=Willisornis vidua TaxID=1566151 RepID=A0ABQ9DB52_9PASS|nr:hypothetical protein WISP_68259 [Willisornis vidua]